MLLGASGQKQEAEQLLPEKEDWRLLKRRETYGLLAGHL
jgi:hypothetical protein